MSHDLVKKQIASVKDSGQIILPSYVCEAMGWEPGTDIVGTKVSGILVLQPAVQPKCCICQSVLRVKKVRDTFICQDCIENAEKNSLYECKFKVWDQGDGYEDECVEECGEFCDYGYYEDNEEDYDSDEFMRN